MHEQIENECIIGLLQQRSCTVYDVHSDNKLSEMLSLFEKGLRSVKVNTAASSTHPPTEGGGPPGLHAWEVVSLADWGGWWCCGGVPV